MENKIKKSAIILTILFIFFLGIDLLLKISIKYFNGYYLLFLSVLFGLAVFSIYTFFILSDIKLNRFKHLKSINYTATIVGMLTFIYWTFIKPDALHLLFPAYTVIFIFFNNLIMSFVYFKWKTGGKYFYDQWLLIITSILIYVFLPKILLLLN
jgi:hypothetical protein